MGSILVVCTGNICRSPVAEGFLRRELRARLGTEAPEVASSGTAGWEGSAASPDSVTAAAEHGVDISTHVARLLRTEQLREASVVIAMASEHSDAVAALVPEAAAKTFTLKELVRLLETLPAPAALEPDGMLAARVVEADALRGSGFQGNPNDEDISDPLGMPLEAYRAIAWELEGWCARLADGLVGRAPARAGAGAGEEE